MRIRRVVFIPAILALGAALAALPAAEIAAAAGHAPLAHARVEAMQHVYVHK